MTSESLLQALAAAHRDGVPLADVPASWRPRDAEAAYAIAEKLVAGLGPVVGWKIGAGSPQGQKFLGLAEPFFGRIFAPRVHRSPARLASLGRTLGLEPEVGFVVGADLAPREKPYARGEVVAAMASLVPVMEINWPAFARPFEVGGTCLIADNGVNDGIVLGAPAAMPRAGAELLAVETRLLVDGRETGAGRCGEVLGDPIQGLVWLANALRRRGLTLARGHVVCAGALTRPADVRAGQHIVADFGPLGRVEASLIR